MARIGKEGVWRPHRTLDRLAGRLCTGPYLLLESSIAHIWASPGWGCGQLSEATWQPLKKTTSPYPLGPRIPATSQPCQTPSVNSWYQAFLGSPIYSHSRPLCLQPSCLWHFPLGPQLRHPPLSDSLAHRWFGSSQPWVFRGLAGFTAQNPLLWGPSPGRCSAGIWE